MEAYDFNTSVSTVIDEHGSLQKFYSLTNELSKTRHVRFTNKQDDVDGIEWHFKYRGHQLTLQYNIYNGVSLTPQSNKDVKQAAKLAVRLKKTV
jgi:hypothetical protein